MTGDCQWGKSVHFMMNESFNEFFYSYKKIWGAEWISNKLSFLGNKIYCRNVTSAHALLPPLLIESKVSPETSCNCSLCRRSRDSPYPHSLHNNALGTYLSSWFLSLRLFNHVLATAKVIYGTNLIVNDQSFKITGEITAGKFRPLNLVYISVSEKSAASIFRIFLRYISRLLQNIGNYLPSYTASRSRRLQS